MKVIFSLVSIAFCVVLHAQKKETYYDYKWKPCDPLVARFYTTVEGTDSGWLRKNYYIGGLKLQMKALFSDSSCKIHNGYQHFFYPNGTVAETGRQVNNKNEGLCLNFHYNGMMADSAFFLKGRQVGTRLTWHPNGFPADSISNINDSLQVSISWFDNGKPSSSGYLKNGKQHGKWQYFHRNGLPAALEHYANGKFVSGEYYDEGNSLQPGTTFREAIKPSLKGGTDAWAKYLERNLRWPGGYKFTQGNMAVTTIGITINEEGGVEDVYVITPFHPEFDQIALQTIKDSPRWNPAIQHNRRVKFRFQQVVTFMQSD
ncbi:MAG: energy transducer TonB [Bacteroidota bacterium]